MPGNARKKEGVGGVSGGRCERAHYARCVCEREREREEEVGGNPAAVENFG